MADDRARKGASIPAWQQSYQPGEEKSPAGDQQLPDQSKISTDSPSNVPPDLSLHEQAKKFLEDESIINAPRDEKEAFLQSKGVPLDEIQKLLGNQNGTSTQSEEGSDLKTIYDSAQSASQEGTRLSPRSPDVPIASTTSSFPAASTATAQLKRDLPPIITYPEFLLKPQKPPPLVTIERLTTAAYALAGISALTYGASKFVIQPMLETLTQARQELASTTQDDLTKLNSKLESLVSHVPYIPGNSTLLQKQNQRDDSDETLSIDSDPTELFHRDIATQTSPRASRSNSLTSSTSQANLSASNPSTSQADRLRSLHGTLSSLLTSTNTHFSQDRLQESVAGFKGVLDKMEQTYNPFTYDYTSSSIGAGFDDKSKSQNKKDAEINKFKAEIRGLKGAFLSSRNFPTARPAQPFALPGR